MSKRILTAEEAAAKVARRAAFAADSARYEADRPRLAAPVVADAPRDAHDRAVVDARTFTTRKGITVTTTLTDADACAVLLLGRGVSTFAANLAQTYARTGSLSGEQLIYAHQIAMRLLGRAA